ncbi:VOC family protein [Kitasatospora sp. NPDC048540]|uniref:VOC family protein n=1 Tax=unclassified Kitasatospora TaxID=2633591 RepID=UPI000539DD89|nr:VOC family protein [Kitasatospora sp. MBT63]
MDWKLEVVVVPVVDLDRAKRFYHEQVGFGLDHDTRIGEHSRVIQLTPRGSGCSIVLGTGIPQSVPGSLRGLQLVVDDVAAARAELAERGVDVTEVRHLDGGGEWRPGPGEPWNSFIFFDDPEGNSWVIQERPATT